VVSAGKEFGSKPRFFARPVAPQRPDVGAGGKVFPALAEPLVGLVENVIGDQLFDGCHGAKSFHLSAAKKCRLARWYWTEAGEDRPPVGENDSRPGVTSAIPPQTNSTRLVQPTRAAGPV